MSSFKTTQALSDIKRNQEKINRQTREEALTTDPDFVAAEAKRNTLLEMPAARLAEEQIGVATPVRDETADLSPKAQMVADQMLGQPQQPVSREQELSQRMLAEQSDDPLIKELMRTQMFDEQGRPFSPTEQQARSLLDEAKELSGIQTTADIPFQYQSIDQFKSEMQSVNLPVTASAGAVNKLVNLGRAFTGAISDVGTPAFTSSDPDMTKLQDYLQRGGLLNADGTVSLKFGNVLALQFAENVLDELNRRDQMTMEGLDPEDSYMSEDSVLDYFQEVETGNPITRPKAGMRINPLFERSRFGKGILNRALQNQGQVGAATVLFGGEGDRADAKSLEALDGLSYMAMNQLGFIKEVTHEGNTFYDFTEDAISFFDGVREVLDDVFPERSILPSLTPLTNGVGFGLERDRGFKQTGNVSVKSKRSDSNEELDALNHMGRTAMRVNDNGLNTLSNIVHANIRYNIKNRRVVLSRRAFIDQHPTKFCSTHPTATLLGISENDWDKYYRSAIMREGVTEADAAQQADLIIAMQARLRIKNLMVADQFKDRSFYMKRFYASANNRFHFRNSAFDPQNSKAVRNMLISANPIFIDSRQPDAEIMRNFKYIIGRALLNKEDFQSVNPNTTRAEDMGFNATLKLAEEVIFNPESKRFSELVAKGKLIRKLSQTLDPIKFRELFEALPADLQKLYSDKDDWGLKSQAYIDLANYADTINPNKAELELIPIVPLTAEGQLTSVRMQQLQAMMQDAQEMQDLDQIQILEKDIMAEQETFFAPVQKTRKNDYIFQAKATAKHDGKQSGMAIYGLLYGIENMVKRVGLIYEDETNIINEGDIRDYYMTHLIPSINSIFKNADKKSAYEGLFTSFMQDPDNAKDFAKAVSRAPLMETSYGSYIGFQHETVMALLGHPTFGSRFSEAIESIKVDIPTYTDRDAISDLNLVLAATLQQVLVLDYQSHFKDQARIFAAMGETPYFITPTGKKSFYGSREVYETGEVVQVPLGDGTVMERPVKATQPSGTKRTSKIPLIYDMEIGKLVKGQPSAFGQETINQLPVLFIQSIDGAVMAKTINYVNKNRKNPLFFVDIHDSLITDARSVGEYHSAYNRIFKELIGPTEKGYSPIKSAIIPLLEAKANFEARLADDERFMVSDNNPKFRALHATLKDINTKLFNAEREEVSPELAQLFTIFRKPGRHPKKAEAIQRLSNLLKNWDADGAMLTGKEIKALINFLIFFYKVNENAVLLDKERMASLTQDSFGYDSIESQLAKIAYQLN